LLYSIRSRIFAGFLGVALLVCGVALLVGSRLLYEAKHSEIPPNALSVFVLVTLGGLGLAVGLGAIIAKRIWPAGAKLINAGAQVSGGHLGPEIGPVTEDDIGVFQKAFRHMTASLKERDELQKHESESRLLQFEKQASIGKLAGGVAHEINNPLTGILTFTHMLLKNTNLTEEVRADLETIAEETERVRQIVKKLLDFSRQTELQRELTDVNRMVRSTVSLVENQALIKGLDLRFESGEELPRITLDPNQIQSVLLNLIINALDATSPGGQVSMKTGIGQEANRPGRKGIEITCRDTGCGIASENMDKIFDPFFTTKEVGQGTGLGLSVSYGIVERHGGTIRVQSKVGQGSTFTIWLPVEE
jgi:two-component system, NtrC family, sensor kinase